MSHGDRGANRLGSTQKSVDRSSARPARPPRAPAPRLALPPPSASARSPRPAGTRTTSRAGTAPPLARRAPPRRRPRGTAPARAPTPPPRPASPTSPPKLRPSVPLPRAAPADHPRAADHAPRIVRPPRDKGGCLSRSEAPCRRPAHGNRRSIVRRPSRAARMRTNSPPCLRRADISRPLSPAVPNPRPSRVPAFARAPEPETRVPSTSSHGYPAAVSAPFRPAQIGFRTAYRPRLRIHCPARAPTAPRPAPGRGPRTRGTAPARVRRGAPS